MQGGWQPPSGGGGGYGGPSGYGPPPPQQQAYAPQQAPYGGGSMGAPLAYGNYEFTDAENAIIDKTASRAKTWGIISIVIGALQLLASLGAVVNKTLLGQAPGGIVALVVGVSFLGAGTSLKNVVQTQGNDIPHMMVALQKISSAFFVQIIATIVGVVLVGIILVLVLFLFAAAAASR